MNGYEIQISQILSLNLGDKSFRNFIDYFQLKLVAVTDAVNIVDFENILIFLEFLVSRNLRLLFVVFFVVEDIMRLEHTQIFAAGKFVLRN